MIVVRTAVRGSRDLTPEPIDGSEPAVAEAIVRVDRAALLDQPLALALPDTLDASPDLVALLTALPEWAGPAPIARGGRGFDEPAEHLALRELFARRALARFGPTDPARLPSLAGLVRALCHQGRQGEVIALAAPCVGAQAVGEVPGILNLLGFVLAFQPRSRVHDDVLTSLSGRPERWWVEQQLLWWANTLSPERMLAWTEAHAPDATPDGGSPWFGWHDLTCINASHLGHRAQAELACALEVRAANWTFEQMFAHAQQAVFDPSTYPSSLRVVQESVARMGQRSKLGHVLALEAHHVVRADPDAAARLLERAVAVDPRGPHRPNLAGVRILCGDLEGARHALVGVPSDTSRAHLLRLALTDPREPQWERYLALTDRRIGLPHGDALVFARIAEGLVPGPRDSRRVRVRARARRLAAFAGFPEPFQGPLVDAPTAVPVGDYDLLGELGRGAMGVVYGAVHRGTGREVAVKVLTGDRARRESWRGAFLAEMAVQATLAHPHIVEVVDAGTIDALAALANPELEQGSGWFAMERVRGGTLSTRCGEARWDEALPLLLAILDALAHCHARGVIHCDLKPANILLEPGRPRITDFGIARVASVGPAGGTPPYMAPEQFRGQVSPQTDLYALGVLTFELLQGLAPFLGSTRRLAEVHRDAPRPRLEGQLPVPRGFDGWIARAMAVDPLERFASAAHMADGLMALGEAVEGPRTPPRRARTALSTLIAFDADPVLVPTERVPSALRPIPEGWAARGGVAGRLARAGLGSLHLRSPPMQGRVAERDALWKALRRAVLGPVTVEIAGSEGLGGRVLVSWLCARVRELCVAHTPSAPAEVRSAGLQVLVVPELSAIADLLTGWRSQAVPVLIVARVEAPTTADQVVHLTPFDDHEMADLLSGFVDLSADAVAELVVQAEGYPDAALHAVRDAHARGVLETTAAGLRNVDRWQVASALQLARARAVDPRDLPAAALGLLTAPAGSRHPGRVVAALAAMSLDDRRETFARAADALEGRAPAEWVLLLRACGPPERAVFDALLAHLGSILGTSWHTSLRGFLSGSGPYGSAVVNPRDFRIGPEHPSSALIALHAAKACLWRSDLEAVVGLCDRVEAVEGPERARLVAYAGYLRATVAWRRGQRAEALRMLDAALADLEGPERLVALGRRSVWRLRMGEDVREDFAYLFAHHEPALVASQWLLGLELAGRAQEGLETFANLAPTVQDDPVVRGRHGTLLVEVGRYAEAEVVFRETAELVPVGSMRWLVLVENLAWTLSYLDRLPEARACLQRVGRQGGPSCDALWLALRADEPDADLERYHRRLIQPGADSLLHPPSMRWAYDTARDRAAAAGLTERVAWLGAARDELLARATA